VTLRDDHLAQARTNRQFAEKLLTTLADDPAALQWAMTVTFYAAVHCVEAHFSTLNLRYQNHLARAEAMRDPQNGVPGVVYLAYMQLRMRSERGRYRLAKFSDREVRRALDDYLAVITNWVGIG
jgi:hypothetical protein